MSFDAHKNFAYSTVATAPSPATSGTTLHVQTGDGSLFPTAPFNATVWPAGVQPAHDNAEIVRVTAVSTDTFTITRAQESSTARAIAIGDQIAATITAKTVTDIESAGGGDTLHTVSSSGSALTVDYSTADVWDITLSANCTFTLTGATNGVPDTLSLILRQDATGGRKITWPGSITWLNGSQPTLHTAASSADIVQLFSDDGGTTWLGAQAAPPNQLDYVLAGSDLTITATSAATAQTYISGNSVVYDGSTTIKIEFMGQISAGSASSTFIIELYDGSTDLGRFGQYTFPSSTGSLPYYTVGYLTPSAGSHAYNIKAWTTVSNGIAFSHNIGGAAVQGSFMRITRA